MLQDERETFHSSDGHEYYENQHGFLPKHLRPLVPKYGTEDLYTLESLYAARNNLPLPPSPQSPPSLSPESQRRYDEAENERMQREGEDRMEYGEIVRAPYGFYLEWTSAGPIAVANAPGVAAGDEDEPRFNQEDWEVKEWDHVQREYTYGAQGDEAVVAAMTAVSPQQQLDEDAEERRNDGREWAGAQDYEGARAASNMASDFVPRNPAPAQRPTQQQSASASASMVGGASWGMAPGPSDMVQLSGAIVTPTPRPLPHAPFLTLSSASLPQPRSRSLAFGTSRNDNGSTVGGGSRPEPYSSAHVVVPLLHGGGQLQLPRSSQSMQQQHMQLFGVSEQRFGAHQPLGILSRGFGVSPHTSSLINAGRDEDDWAFSSPSSRAAPIGGRGVPQPRPALVGSPTPPIPEECALASSQLQVGRPPAGGGSDSVRKLGGGGLHASGMPAQMQSADGAQQQRLATAAINRRNDVEEVVIIHDSDSEDDGHDHHHHQHSHHTSVPVQKVNSFDVRPPSDPIIAAHCRPCIRNMGF